ncbi:phage tail tape measure protein [Aeromonas sp. sia0103]|uniref:phage tail tape measure protein n=1 Tax=Aeromonas sp. sia0103 TaxID=2854782 RepID=UPI001C437FFB|nr:phage tail tape measure protein [Aeromonas sp. sia0103]MBV7598921.1 phage tail tape measure protein [Aeromonas sp. sia0103]
MSQQLKLQIMLGAVDKLTAPLKAISRQSTLTAKDLAATKKSVRDLEQQSAQIDGYKKLGAQIGVTNAQLKDAQAKFDGIKQAIEASTAPTRMMVNEYNKAQKALGNLTTKQQDMVRSHGDMGQALRQTGIDTKALSDHQRRLKTDLAAANDQLKHQREQLDAVTRQQRKLAEARAGYQKTQALRGNLAASGVSNIATGMTVGATALAPISAYAKAEAAITELRVTMMGANGKTGKEFDEISALATRLGNRLPGTTAEFQLMMSTLIQQGMSAKAVLGGLGEASALLGVQLKMPFDQAAQFAAKLQDATRTTEGDMLGLMDTIQRMSYLGMDSNNMQQAFSNLSPALGILRMDGLAATKALAPLVVMADQAAMAGESAGNAYRKVFQMSMNSGQVAKVTQGTGLSLNFTDGKGEFAGLDNLFAQLAKLKALSTEQRLAVLKGIYGDDAQTLQVLNLLIDKGKAGYDEVQRKMAAQASLQLRVNAQLGTLGNLWDAATGTFTNAMVNVGEAIAPEIKALTTWVTDLSERLGQWAKDNPELANTLMKMAGVIALVTAAFGGLSLILAALLGPLAMLRLTLTTLGITFGGLFGAVGALLGPLALFVAAGIAIIKFWEPIKAFFSGLFEGILAGLQPVFDAFKPFAPLVNGIGNAFTNLLEPLGFTKETLDAVSSAGRFVGEILGWAFNAALTPLKTLLSGLTWVLEAFGVLEKVKGPRLDLPSQPSGYVTGNAGSGPASAGSSGYGPSLYQPPALKPTASQTSSVVHAPITVYQQPGQSGVDVAREVRLEMERLNREQSRKQNASTRDNQ